jgi:serine/threonine protein kinase
MPGFQTTIHCHVPPQPFGPFYSQDEKGRYEVRPLDMPSVPHSEWCLRHPPGNGGQPAKPVTYSIRLLEQLSCKQCHGPKVFSCSLGDREEELYVVKIYDPLYYKYPMDVTYWAELDYSYESAAYQDLEISGLSGRYTPKYYGSWSFNLPFPSKQPLQRTVCCVLMEKLNGYTLESILIKSLTYRVPPTDRLNILAEVLEIEKKLEFAGVRHRDVAPRNVMLVGLDLDNYKRPKVMLFDFNVSFCLNRPNCRKRKPPVSRPLNHMCFCWDGPPDDFEFWVPEPHRSRQEAWRGWVKTRWYKSAEFADGEADSFCLYGSEIEDDPVEHVPPNPDPLSAPLSEKYLEACHT